MPWYYNNIYILCNSPFPFALYLYFFCIEICHRKVVIFLIFQLLSLVTNMPTTSHDRRFLIARFESRTAEEVMSNGDHFFWNSTISNLCFQVIYIQESVHHDVVGILVTSVSSWSLGSKNIFLPPRLPKPG